MARSNLRLKKYTKAKKYYKKAESRGYKLLEHDENRFSSEIGALDLTSAYKVALRFKSKEKRHEKFRKIKSRLQKISEEDMIRNIEEMAEIGKLPNILSRLLPWSPKSKIHDEVKESTFKQLTHDEIILDRQRRELSRLRSSGAYQILDHISLSLHNPLKILSLPFSTTILIAKLMRNRLGRTSLEKNETLPMKSDYEKRNSIVFFPTNGVGFGHFSRMLALARKIKKKSEETEIVFFTTMPTLHLLTEEGFVGYYLPGRYHYESMEPRVWNTLCEEILNLILLQHSPSHFIFDGSFPYRGMLNAISNVDSDLTKIWVKRGSVKKNAKKLPVDSYDFFDAILRPGDSFENDFSDEYDHGLTLKEVNPMLIYDQSSPKSSYSLKRRLDIPEDSILAYVQLGAGRINEIDNLLSMTLKILSNYPHCYVIMAESLIGERLDMGQERMRLLRDYPNSRWFGEIDFSIIAGGYNSYHEMVEFCVPSLVIPNLNTGRDDQVKRIQASAKNGAMVMIKKPNKVTLEAAIDRIMDPEVRKLMSRKLNRLRKPNGALEAADWIINQ